jgi:hypothetical protein
MTEDPRHTHRDNGPASSSLDRHDPPSNCTATTRLGRPCLANPRVGRPYCIAHDPEFRARFLEGSREGGLASGHARNAAANLEVDGLDLTNRGGLQALIDVVLRLELTGQLSVRRSRSIGRLLALAVRNVDSPEPRLSQWALGLGLASPGAPDLDALALALHRAADDPDSTESLFDGGPDLPPPR